MKHLINSYVCPSCGRLFPLFIRPSQSFRRGFFSSSGLRCSNCGTICKPKLCFIDALWAWALTFISLAIIIIIFRMTPLLKSLYEHSPGIYGALAGGLGGLIAALGFRRGFRLIPMFEESEAPSKPSRALKLVIPIALMIAVAIYSYLTHRFSIYLGMIGIGAVIWALYYVFSQKRVRESEENHNE